MLFCWVDAREASTATHRIASAKHALLLVQLAWHAITGCDGEKRQASKVLIEQYRSTDITQSQTCELRLPTKHNRSTTN
jgi:hypothetical protein